MLIFKFFSLQDSGKAAAETAPSETAPSIESTHDEPSEPSEPVTVDPHANEEEDKSAEVKSKIILKANLWILRFL